MKKRADDGERKTPIGLGLQTTSCGVGILITEIDVGSAASLSSALPTHGSTVCLTHPTLVPSQLHNHCVIRSVCSVEGGRCNPVDQWFGTIIPKGCC